MALAWAYVLRSEVRQGPDQAEPQLLCTMVLTRPLWKGTLVGNNAAGLSPHHRTEFHRNCRPSGLWWSATRL